MSGCRASAAGVSAAAVSERLGTPRAKAYRWGRKPWLALALGSRFQKPDATAGNGAPMG
jgi:hypothetical protein